MENSNIQSEKQEQRGQLKILIGYAPGVGKTYTMLNEGNRRKKYGEDVVIGYVETHNRNDTKEQIYDLEIVPYKKIKFNNSNYEEMDTDLILTRSPFVVLVDELEHVNVIGSKNKRRYMDVEELLDAGINVVGTLNIQYIESLNDIIFNITGVRIKETVPDSFIERAHEVVVVDISPDSLHNRLMRGKIYKMECLTDTMKSFFKHSNLNALRELSLRQIAEDVNDELEEELEEEGNLANWYVTEKIAVCISSSPTAKKLIRRGARLAKRYKCEWYVVKVNSTRNIAQKRSLRSKQLLYTNFKLAKQLGAEIVTLEGRSVTEELVKWCQHKQITQMFIGYPKRSFWEWLIRGSTVNKLIKTLNNVDLHLISNDIKRK